MCALARFTNVCTIDASVRERPRVYVNGYYVCERVRLCVFAFVRLRVCLHVCVCVRARARVCVCV